LKKFSNKLKGFTLIELLIVVAIIGILAAIAIPNFIKYQLRSKTAEARTNIGGIKTSQESFHSTEDQYANVTASNPTSVPGTTKGNFNEDPCNSACNRTSTEDCNEFSCIGFKPAGGVYYQYESPHRLAAGTQTPEFCVAAVADLDGDGNQGQFELQSNNAVNGTVGLVDCTNAAGCATGITAWEVADCAPGRF
jgi:type IV pilus assembly protein PilA